MIAACVFAARALNFEASSGAHLSEPDPRSDLELICAVNAGHEAAFEALYFRYRDRVAALAFRFTRHHEDALDVTQEVFTYFLRKFPGFVLTSSLMTFFYPAVKNLSIAARRKRLRATGGNEKLDDLLAPPAASEPSELAGALRKLGEAHREVILMRFVDGLSLDEISQALDVPLGTVKSRLHTALQLLRDDPATRRY